MTEPKQLTSDELKAIRERCDKATPGPWRHNGRSIWSEDGRLLFYVEDFYLTKTEESHNNEAFACNARSDIPALIAHITFLEKYNERLRMQALNEGRRI